MLLLLLPKMRASLRRIEVGGLAHTRCLCHSSCRWVGGVVEAVCAALVGGSAVSGAVGVFVLLGSGRGGGRRRACAFVPCVQFRGVGGKDFGISVCICLL